MSEVTRAFPLELLQDWDAPSALEVDTFTEDVGRRWMDVCTVVFKAPDDGHLYLLVFEVGKTEYQETGWDENLDDVVVLPRVEQRERTVVEKYWAPVEVEGV